MDAAVERMEAQLTHWSTKIEKLASRVQKPGAPARFEDLIYIDELKGLLAIARSKLGEFKAAEHADRARLMGDLRAAWTELVAAFGEPVP